MPDIVKGSKKKNPYVIGGYVDGGSPANGAKKNTAGAGVTTGSSVANAVKSIFSGNSNNLTNWKNTNAGNAIIDAISGGLSGRKNISTGNSYQQVEMPSDIGDLPTYDSTYMDTLNKLARQLISMNYDDWTKGDQYKSLSNRYGENGRMSMQDVLGQVSSRTGGLASSYATSAAQQQYNQYMAQLEEVARQMYSQDRSDLLDNANLYRNLANDEYDRYRDSLADYNAQKAAKNNSADYQFDFTAGTGPRIENSGNKVKATGSGVASFSDIQRTISGRLYAGDAEGAAQLVESVWDDLSTKQKQDIKKMGFNVSD